MSNTFNIYFQDLNDEAKERIFNVTRELIKKGYGDKLNEDGINEATDYQLNVNNLWKNHLLDARFPE